MIKICNSILANKKVVCGHFLDNTYNNAFDIQRDLLKRKVKGALLDGYMAGSYKELFEDELLRVHELIDYKTGYGIVLGGQSRRLQKCFRNYLKRKRSYIIDHIAKEVKTVKVSGWHISVDMKMF